MRDIIGIFAGIIVIFASIPYLIDVKRKKARPARSTWIMFVILLFLGVIQSGSLGSGYSRFLIIGDITTCTLVLLFSFRYGISSITTLDIVCYSILTLDIILWQLLDNPLLGLLITISADLVAITPTIVKTYIDPSSETPAIWLITTFASLLAIFSENEISLVIIIFPLYLALTNGVIGVMTFRKKNMLLKD